MRYYVPIMRVICYDGIADLHWLLLRGIALPGSRWPSIQGGGTFCEHIIGEEETVEEVRHRLVSIVGAIVLNFNNVAVSHDQKRQRSNTLY